MQDENNENLDNSSNEIKDEQQENKPVLAHVNEQDTIIDDEMKHSFLSYAMSVIVSRALPDVRDGLKPVHRRILYTMHEMGLSPSKPFKKSARVVGDVMGKYHPHGDAAIYETMVRMAQDFSLRYPLVTGQGNFGSIDGDSAAAMRYTEARMQKLTEDLLADIEKETVDFGDNYDESLKEPKVLPAKFPNLLVNGSVGIAVGMATNIPPHNMREVCAATLALINDSELTSRDLADYIKGPDFPTGGTICGINGIKLAYETGHGKAIVRSKTHFEDVRGRAAIVVDEIPYQVNKANLVEQIAALVRSKQIEGIHDIRDESSRGEIRVVIELKKDAQQEVILAHLLKHTRMQVTCGMNHICLVNGVPRVLPLKDFLSNFLEHRFDVVTKRTQFELTKAQKRAHILLGLKVAIDNLDNTIKIVRNASEAKEAKDQLIAAYQIDDVQAQAILDMKLQRLTGLERDKLLDEYNRLLELITDLESILASSEKKYAIISEELTEIMTKYGDERRTEISTTEVADVDIEDLIVDEDVVVTITHGGYIKRIPLDTYRAQRRGGKGVIGTKTKEEDSVERIFVANSKSPLLFFTSNGQVQWLKVYQIPEGARQSKGRAIVNLLNLSADERVNAVIPVKEFRDDQFLVLATKHGVVKKSSLMAYSRPRAGGIHAIKLDEGDELINAALTGGNHHIMIATKNGLAARFHEKDARELGRVSRGVRGIRLGAGDEVVGMIVADETEIAEKTILTVTENGYGKRTKIEEYRLINRGGKGVINIQTSERNGKVVSVKVVDAETGLLLISKHGITIRTRSDQISIIGRNTQGVRLMNLSGADTVVSCAIVAREDGDEEEELDEVAEKASAEEIAQASQPVVEPEDDAESDIDVDSQKRDE